MDEILKCDYSKKATEQLFPVVLFIMLYKMVLTVQAVDQILKCDHLNKSCRAVFFCVALSCNIFKN